MATHGKGSTLEEIKIHRTKCECLIKNIISPSVKSDLIDDFKGRKYAIFIDESTDISIQKHLCSLLRYVSEKKNEIITAFLGLIPVLQSTRENVFS